VAARDRLSTGERLKRARRIGVVFGRIYLGIKTNQFIANRLAPRDMKQRWSRFHAQSARSIYQAAIDLHGMILKGCQFMGARADVMPSEYVEALGQLQDRVPPRPFEVVRTIVEDELEAPLDSIFATFSKEPIAAASLAQVHEATLHSGERVAVKVQYPEIAALVESDLANLRTLFLAVGFLEREFDLVPLIDELNEYVPLELDFANEGRNAEAIGKSLMERGDIWVPGIHWHLTTSRVLVMDFVDGVKITNREQLDALGIDAEQVMRTLIEAYCEQILVQGFFHADPHPGNLMVIPPEPGAANAKPKVVFLDFGLAKRLPPDFKQGMVRFAVALLQGQPELMARALVDLGFATRDDPLESLRSVSAVILDAAKQLRRQSYADPDVLRETGRDLATLIRENPLVQVPDHLVLLARVTGLLSGVGKSLGVRVDMLKIILPYALGQLQTPSSPAGGATEHGRPT